MNQVGVIFPEQLLQDLPPGAIYSKMARCSVKYRLIGQAIASEETITMNKKIHRSIKPVVYYALMFGKTFDLDYLYKARIALDKLIVTLNGKNPEAFAELERYNQAFADLYAAQIALEPEPDTTLKIVK